MHMHTIRNVCVVASSNLEPGLLEHATIISTVHANNSPKPDTVHLPRFLKVQQNVVNDRPCVLYYQYRIPSLLCIDRIVLSPLPRARALARAFVCLCVECRATTAAFGPSPCNRFPSERVPFRGHTRASTSLTCPCMTPRRSWRSA